MQKRKCLAELGSFYTIDMTALYNFANMLSKLTNYGNKKNTI